MRASASQAPTHRRRPASEISKPPLMVNQTGRVTPMTFDKLFAAGRASVRSGSHGVERDPRMTGRWGPSVVLLPQGDVARRIADLTSAAADALHGVHWLSGGIGRAHLTVRALERYTESVDPERLARYRAAVQRAVQSVGPLSFELRGVGISGGSLMLSALPVNASANTLRTRLGAELGWDGWLEDSVFESGRDPIWYCSILHYAEELTDVESMIRWVDLHADVQIGFHTFDSVEICWWAHDGVGMAPRVAASLPART